MTWKEFKTAVEAAGLTDDAGIAWIDVSYPTSKEDLLVALVTDNPQDGIYVESTNL